MRRATRGSRLGRRAHELVLEAVGAPKEATSESHGVPNAIGLFKLTTLIAYQIGPYRIPKPTARSRCALSDHPARSELGPIAGRQMMTRTAKTLAGRLAAAVFAVSCCSTRSSCSA
jgi:hypothetical protein